MGSGDDTTLDGSAYLQIAREVERFEKAWSDGALLALDELLKDAPPVLYDELLRHGLVVELIYRRNRGETPTVAEYDWRFPLQVAVVKQAFAEASTSPPVPPPAPASKPLPEKIGKYTVRERLGEGGQGSTFLARDPDLGHLVVLKRYHGGASAAALHEGQALCHIRSRHTAQCLGLERDGDLVYLIMEYIAGPSLAVLRSESPPTADAAAKLIEQVAEGLEAVHACGLLHRDLKPSNIVVGDDGVPRLVDFGLAAHLGSVALQGLSGTASYMAPEQAREEWMRIDFRTDVYGLGATLYALLTGVPPHPAGSASESLLHARKGGVTPPHELELNPPVPRRLERIVLKALAAEPAQRYATAAEFRRALRQYRFPVWRRAVLGLGALAASILFVMMLLPRLQLEPERRSRVPRAVVRGDVRRHSIDLSSLRPRVPLTGELIVRVWSRASDGKKGLKVDDPGALPVRSGDWIHLEARLNRPAYAYLLWFDSQGGVASLYPWDDRAFGSRPASEALSKSINSPPQEELGWPMNGPPGLETALLLVRQTPLPPETNLADLIGRLPPSPLRDPQEVAVRGFDRGQPVHEIDRGEHRGLGVEAERIDDPLLQVMEKLRPHFDVIRAVRFAYRG